MLIQTDRLLRKFTFKLSTFLDWPGLVSALETILVVFVDDRLRLHPLFLGLNCESAETKLEEKILWPVFVSIRFFRRLTSRSFLAFTRLLSQLKFLGETWSSVSSLTGPWMSACSTMSLPAFCDRWLGGEKLRFELFERSVELAVHREVSDRDICELSVLSFLEMGCLETE